jgi:hypothetical protein
MEQVSRPFQIVLVLVLGFAGLWFVALRPKPDTGGGGAPAPTPAAQTPAPKSDAAAPPKKSPIPGGLGRSVDKANATKAQGDAAAAAADAPVQNTTATPIQTPPAKPVVQTAPPAPKVAAAGTGLVRAGTVAIGLVNTGIDKTIGAQANSVTVKRAAPQRSAKAIREGRPGFASPAKIRAALAKRHAVVLLFYSARSSDDRAVRRELSAVDTRGGRVQAWGVSVRGLSRFKNVLQGAQVLQSPSVVVLSHHKPYVFSGYTDHAEIDQAAAVALRPRS